MKVAVIGYSGAGKSTLAQELGQRLEAPVLHLDTVQFLPGWQERDREEARALVEGFLHQPAWIIDGNYREFCEERRMDEADIIVFLNFPRLTCFLQALKRYRRYKGRTRASMAEGCPEKFDWEFVRWLLWEGRVRARRHRFRDITRRYAEKVVVCRSRNDVHRCMDAISRKK